MITGQLMVRETSTESNGRKVLMVYGLIAAEPGEVLDLKGEHQYDVGGVVSPAMECIALTVKTSDPVDRTKDARGALPSTILCMPIWRV